MRLSLGIIGRKCNSGARSPAPHIGRHAFAVLAILKGMLLETLQKVFGHKSITYVLRIHSLVRRRRGNLFLEVAHLYDQRADQLSQLLIRACFNNCQFHTKILFLRF